MLKIIESFPGVVDYVTSKDDETGEYGDFIRLEKDVWMIRMGESLEPVYDTEELETIYQKYNNDMIDE